MTVPLLPPDQLAQLADMVAERLLERMADTAVAGPGPRLVDAEALARMFSVGRSTIHEHAAELGAVQLGQGKRALVRFDVDRARAAWTARGTSEQSHRAEAPEGSAIRRRRRRAAARSDGALLPVGGHGARAR